MKYNILYATRKTNPLHCKECIATGYKEAKYKLSYQFNGSENVWEDTFPCEKSRYEFLNDLLPFINNHTLESL